MTRMWIPLWTFLRTVPGEDPGTWTHPDCTSWDHTDLFLYTVDFYVMCTAEFMVRLDVNDAAYQVLLFWVSVLMLIDWGEFICEINVCHQTKQSVAFWFFLHVSTGRQWLVFIPCASPRCTDYSFLLLLQFWSFNHLFKWSYSHRYNNVTELSHWLVYC